MKLYKMNIILVGLLVSLNVSAYSEPISQMVEHQDHQSHTFHGVESQLTERSPFSVLPEQDIQDSKMHTTLNRASTTDAVKACDLSAFINESNTVEVIKDQGTDCINKLFSANSEIQEAAFESGNMYNVAKHTTRLAQSYGGGGSEDLQAFYLYLRAGYYAEYYNKEIDFLPWVTPAVKEAIDTFVSNPFFYQSNDAHGKVLSEVIIAMDSANLQHAYLDVLINWLNRWNRDYAQHWSIRNAVNSIFTVLYRGQWNTEYVSTIGSRNDLVMALSNFALNEAAIGADDEFMAANAGRELGRLTMYKNTAIQPLVKSKLQSIFARYNMYGFGDAVWLAAADTASHYSECADYGICGFEPKLKALVLSQSYTCSDSLRILSQDMTDKQHQAACDKMGYEETYFHTLLETGNQPVENDFNTQLQINIFDSSSDYQKYAGIIFGISTNNGGMYLEGDPSKPNNVPNFVAYEAPYANAEHYVWNLEHEFIHYLDGRFNMFGDFAAPTEKVVWWSEGIAEYVANEDNNSAALDTIKDGSVYTLSQIFETTYDGFDVDRIYRWGYLAVRFMFSQHKNEINSMLVETRAGDWGGYKAIIQGWEHQYQSEFEQWQQDLISHNSGKPKAVISVSTNGKIGTDIPFSSANSTDNDGVIVGYMWNFGDGTSSQEANPIHQYSNKGTYTVTLTVTDDSGLSASASTSIAVSQEGGHDRFPINCAIENKVTSGRLAAGEVVCLGSHQPIWLSISEVSKYQTMSITTANGSGNLKLEYSNFDWPNGSNLHAWSDNAGNDECITLSWQNQYWGYLKISGEYENAAIVVDFDKGCQ
ncbi:collagenase [Photobacterium sanguinicancri]|uniref:microbial collagenase n=1 Tax=Photobacterium sanguinicancri TaxID=875932 RepID=A0AAW7Y4J0_9GAMM|nr:collagenase [Photobacterium sanguinicancri]MDO6542248.1 collagenase [Photobacterium sanguinicancri]